MIRKNNRNGFTLLEVLLVVAIIAILAGIVILAINPSKQLADTRNAQRRVDVNTILSAVYQYELDNNGNAPASASTTAIPTAPTAAVEICKSSVLAATCSTATLVDFSTTLTVNEKYLTAIPTDPSGGSTSGTGYKIQKTANGRITVSAPSAENGATISITR